MDNLFCNITGGQPTPMIKLFLRLLFFAILATVKFMFGMDWALIVAVVIVVSDLEEIEKAIRSKFKDCK